MAMGRKGERAKGRNGDGATAAATKWLNRIAQGFSPGYDSQCGCALKAPPAPRPRGAIPNRRSTPTLQYSITPRGRIRGRGRRASRGRASSLHEKKAPGGPGAFRGSNNV